MHNEIKYIIVREYGLIRRRIVNDNDAVKAFKSLTDRRTLTDRDIIDLKHLGATLIEVRESNE